MPNNLDFFFFFGVFIVLIIIVFFNCFICLRSCWEWKTPFCSRTNKVSPERGRGGGGGRGQTEAEKKEISFINPFIPIGLF